MDTSLYPKHRMKPGKHDFWKRTLSENNFWPAEKREPLFFSRAKGGIREYTGAGAIKDQRLTRDVRWKHIRPALKQTVVRYRPRRRKKKKNTTQKPPTFRFAEKEVKGEERGKEINISIKGITYDDDDELLLLLFFEKRDMIHT